jgi:hypothetical protein
MKQKDISQIVYKPLFASCSALAIAVLETAWLRFITSANSTPETWKTEGEQ